MTNHQKLSDFISTLANVNVSVSLAPLGSSEKFQLKDYPKEYRPFINRYVQNNCTDSAQEIYEYSVYLYKQTADIPPEKPKFKMTFREMLEFDEACEMAAGQCPQYRGEWGCHTKIVAAEMFKDDSWGAKDLVKHWAKATVLWDSGYDVYLNEDAQEVFRKWKLYQAARILYKAQKNGNIV